MREIRFKYLHNGKWHFIDLYKDNTRLYWEEWESKNKTSPLLQSTSLKDKNGKEIYEGDIVRRMALKFDFERPDGEDHWREEETSFVEYRNNGFWVKDEDFGWEGENLWSWDEMEVIGNIYEHPELLNP